MKKYSQDGLFEKLEQAVDYLTECKASDEEIVNESSISRYEEMFDECGQYMKEGYRQGDPLLSYLYAEMVRSDSYWADELESESAAVYKIAAECGSVLAQLWFMYQADQGVFPYPKVSISERILFPSAVNVLETIRLNEVEECFVEKFEEIWAASEQASREEEQMADNGLESSTDPNELILYLRLIEFVKYAHELRLPIFDEPHFRGTYEIDSESGIYLLEEKEKWEQWCRNHNLLKQK